MTIVRAALMVLVVAVSGAIPLAAEEVSFEGRVETATAADSAEVDSEPVPDVCGEVDTIFGPQTAFATGLADRDRLTGDWLGHRSRLADDGITIEADTVQFYQGVAHGGVREQFRYAGHNDFQLGFDLGKLAGWEGWSLNARAEHRWGRSVAQDAGVLFPPALHAVSPTPETEDLILTNLLFMGQLNEHVAVLFGKLDTLDGDRNPFASGRGKTQFLNTNLLLPVNGLPTVPLATLGAGAVFLVDELPFAQVLVMNATDTITTSGFDELFENGAVILAGVNVPVPIAGKMGLHSFNGAWSSKTFTSLDQDARLVVQGVPLQRTSGSWLLWWSGAQYLFQDPDDPLKGWGLFGRAGASDGEVNPVRYFFNAGIGGQSPFAGRKLDQFGIGWFYNRFSNELGPIATTALGLESASTGVELYYNYAVTPYFKVTPDLQLIEPGTNRANTALIAGVRVQVDF